MIDYYKIEKFNEGEILMEGSCLEKCLVIIRKTDYETFGSKLEDILRAVGMDKKKDVAICILENQEYAQVLYLIPEYGIDKVISFGDEMRKVFPNVNIPFYQPFNSESYSWLSAPSLELIMNDHSQKMMLWKALQKMFKIYV